MVAAIELAFLFRSGGFGLRLNNLHIVRPNNVFAALGVSTTGVLTGGDSRLTVGLGSAIRLNYRSGHLHIVLVLNNVAALGVAASCNAALDNCSLTVSAGCTVGSNSGGLNHEGVSRSLGVNRLMEGRSVRGATDSSALNACEEAVAVAGRSNLGNDFPLINGVVVAVDFGFKATLGVITACVCALVSGSLALSNASSGNCFCGEHKVVSGSSDGGLGLNYLVADGALNLGGLTFCLAGGSNCRLGYLKVRSLCRGDTVAMTCGDRSRSGEGYVAVSTVSSALVSVLGSGSFLLGSIDGGVCLLFDNVELYYGLVANAALDTGGLTGLLAGSFLGSGEHVLVCGVGELRDSLAFLNYLSAILAYHLCADTFLEAGGFNDSGSVGISLDVSVLARSIVFAAAGYESSNGEKQCREQKK